jgi:hypothetical protein
MYMLMVENINTWKAKLSQYDHKLDDFIKKKLSDRTMWFARLKSISKVIWIINMHIDINEEHQEIQSEHAHICPFGDGF